MRSEYYKHLTLLAANELNVGYVGKWREICDVLARFSHSCAVLYWKCYLFEHHLKACVHDEVFAPPLHMLTASVETRRPVAPCATRDASRTAKGGGFVELLEFPL
jgi:hypothetical protein